MNDTTERELPTPSQHMEHCAICSLFDNSLQLCIVCERGVCQNDIPPDLRPGDNVICCECDKITPDRVQAGKHFRLRQRMKFS
jgi:hypothetical protein